MQSVVEVIDPAASKSSIPRFQKDLVLEGGRVLSTNN
jgi:hypothetical protein